MRLSVERSVVAVAVVLLAAVPIVAAPFYVTLLNFIGSAALVALGLVLMTGLGGLTSFGQAAFVGVGAYATAWLTLTTGVSPWVGLLLSLASTGLLAAFLGSVTLRLGGHFLPISTIAWGFAIYYLFPEIPGFGQHDGLKDIVPISIAGVSFADNRAIFYIIWIALGGGIWLISNLLNSREGRAIRSLRGGAVMLASLGVSLFRIRLMIFIIAALFAGLSGWIYAHMTRFVSPSPFEIRPSIEYLLMALAGGSASVYGAVLGAGLVVLLKNWIQDILPYFTRSAGQLEIVAYSVLLILLLQYARGGLTSLIVRVFPKKEAPRPAANTGLPRRPPPARGAPLLEIDNATKRFGGLVAVNGVSFEMRAGEILGLIGPNGAGKSTMFNLITGALPSDGGSFRFLGQDITNAPQADIARRGIARTFQHVKLRPGMTLIDNVLLGTYLRTSAGFVSGALRLDRAQEAVATREALDQLARVGLGEKAYDKAGNLPLGNQRVLEVARALASDPILLVLDEPAAGLRKGEKDALANQLRDLRAAGMSILLVEHDMEFVMGLVDRLVVMNFGSKLMEGTPDEARNSAAVQEAYLGGEA